MTDDPGERKGMPRWVKVFGIIGIVVVVVAIAVLVFGGSQHGPGRHLSGHGTTQTSTTCPSASPHHGETTTPTSTPTSTSCPSASPHHT